MTRAAALVVLLACASIGASATLHAQGHGPAARAIRSGDQQVEKLPPLLDEAARARKTEEMEAWLGRLVGQFRVEGHIAWIAVPGKGHGTAVCTRFGDGPGVRCSFKGVHEKPIRGLGGSGPDITEWANIPLLYFGINPDTLEIQLLVVSLGQVGTRSGVLAGDAVNFTTDNWKVCHKTTHTHCWVSAEITAAPAGEIFIKMAADIFDLGKKYPTINNGHAVDLQMNLYRELRVDAEAP